MALQRTPRPHSLKVQTGLGHGVPVQEHAGTGRALRSLGSPLNAYLFGGSFRILRLTALCVILVLASACGANDNSKAVKAHSMIRPGMTLSEAFDVAERTQMADLLVMANPNGCPYDFQIGRQSGPPYIRIYSDPVEPNYKGGNRSYTEQGFENRQRFLEAVSA